MNEQELNLPETALNMPPLPPGASAPVVEPEKKSKKGRLIGLIIGVVLLLGLGGTYAAARFGYITLPIPLPGITNDIIAKSLDALYSTTASEIKAEFSISIRPRDNSIPTIFSSPSVETDSGAPGVSLYGPLLEQVPENFSLSGSVRGYSEKTTGTGKADTTVKVQATAGEANVDFGFDVRLLEEKIYAKINSLTGVPNVDATAVLGQWFITDLADLDTLAPTPADTDADKVLAESKQTIAQVLDLAQKHRLFTTKKNWGTEVIEGVSTRHSSHALDPKQVVPFLEALIAARLKDGADVRTIERMVAELKKDTSQLTLENFSKALTVDLWFDKKAKLMKKIGVTFLLVPPAASETYKNKMFAISYSTTILSSGQIKAIETPTDAKPFEELFTSIKPSSESLPIQTTEGEGSAPETTNTNSGTNTNTSLNINADIEVDMDGDGLEDFIESELYKTDPTKRDSDTDGISDYNELLLCFTNPLKTDSDDDTYNDRDEIMDGYDPSGPGQKSFPECRTVVAGQLEVTVIP